MTRRHLSHIDDPAAFGRRLREVRSRAALRLADLAFDGCSVAYLSHLENGKRVPSLQVVRELAGRLSVSETWLALGEDAARPTPASLLVEADAAARFDDRETAMRLYERVWDIGAGAERARARAGLANLRLLEGAPREAIAGFECALGLDPRLGEDDSFAEALGRAYVAVGELEVALALFGTRRDAAVAAQDAIGMCRFGVLLANALIDSAQLGAAASVLAALLAEGAGTDDPVSLARVFWSQSRLHAMRGDGESAARYARKALDILEATDLAVQRSRAHQLLAYIELDAGHPETALELIERSRELSRWGTTPESLARLDLEEARARAQLGEFDAAASLAMRASQALAGHHPTDLGRCYAEIAAAFERSNDLPRARELYELALGLLEQHVPNLFLPDVLARYAAVLESIGAHDAAFATYKRAAVGWADLAKRGSLR